MSDHGQKWWGLAAIGSGVLLSTIDGSIVNISVNTLVTAFNSNLHIVEWVVLAYLLTLTCLLLLAGRLGDMLGKRRVYVTGFIIFTIASALCSMAPGIAALIAFRVVQAVGAAMVQAVGPALLVTVFPREERGTALGMIGSFVAAGILIGPALGGLLLRYFGWESIFYVNIPIGIAGTWLALRSLPDDKTVGRGQRFDYLGATFLMLSIFALLLGLTEGPQWGWSDRRIIGLFVLCLIAGLLFISWELRISEPMINMRIFRKAAFSYNLLAGFVLFCGMSFNLLLTPLFLQLVYRFELQIAGLILMSLPLTLSLTSPISGRLSDRIGPQQLTIAGLICVAVGLTGISTVRENTPLIALISLLMLIGVGIGLFQSPNNSTVLGNAPPEALGVASGLLAVMRTLGQTGGIALAGAIWTSQVVAIVGQPIEPITAAPVAALADGYGSAMQVAALMALCAIIPSLMGGRAAKSAIAVRSQGG